MCFCESLIAQSWEKEFRDTLLASWNRHIAGRDYDEWVRDSHNNTYQITRSRKILNADDTETIPIPLYCLKQQEQVDSLYKMISFSKNPRQQCSLLKSTCTKRCFIVKLFFPIQEYLDSLYDANPLYCFKRRSEGIIYEELRNDTFYETISDFMEQRPGMHVFKIYNLPDLWAYDGTTLLFLTDDKYGRFRVVDGQAVFNHWVESFGYESIARFSDLTEIKYDALVGPHYRFAYEISAARRHRNNIQSRRRSFPIYRVDKMGSCIYRPKSFMYPYFLTEEYF